MKDRADREELQKKLIEMMKDKKVTIVLAKSPIQEPDHVTKERIERMNGGLTIVDHINKLK